MRLITRTWGEEPNSEGEGGIGESSGPGPSGSAAASAAAAASTDGGQALRLDEEGEADADDWLRAAPADLLLMKVMTAWLGPRRAEADTGWELGVWPMKGAFVPPGNPLPAPHLFPARTVQHG